MNFDAEETALSPPVSPTRSPKGSRSPSPSPGGKRSRSPSPAAAAREAERKKPAYFEVELGQLSRAEPSVG